MHQRLIIVWAIDNLKLLIVNAEILVKCLKYSVNILYRKVSISLKNLNIVLKTFLELPVSTITILGLY